MRYYLFVFCSLLLTVSCGRSRDDEQKTIQGVFKSSNTRLAELDLRSVRLNEGEVLASDLIGSICSGTLRGNPANTTVSDNKVLVVGSLTSGTITFGRLEAALGATSDDPCRVMSTESYTYKLKDDTLTLCNLKYNVCDDFIRQ